MAYNETVITVVGNLTADPELRFTPSGAPVTNFTIASTPRYFDKQANEYKDSETLFMRCNLWREAAENVCESLTRGTRVVAQGRLQARTYEDKEGNQRTSWELQVDEIGASLRYATAKIQKQAPKQGGQGGGYAPPQNTGQPDPWNGQGAGAGGAWDSGQQTEAPF